MLSINESRNLIEGDEEYSDEQIEKIRDDLYGLAEIALESYESKIKQKKH